MFKHIQPIAIAVAFFFAYVVPTVALFVLGGIGASKSGTVRFDATWLSLLLMASYVACPAAGGYFVAYLAKRSSYIHAVILSLIAGISMGLMAEPVSIQFTFMWIGIFSSGSIVGAWIYERLSRAST